ncbi:heat shock protein 70 (HSP70) [Trypanosoma grayi]|uniref:heat shock protein 70 (HSP70) n=1 Tax=Trypanosoma grayi TaxID=71804 RepID=UPI0004F3FF9A|nr:heat shock protein 70 (HSP70) [Trypanosoma grayi]KEG10091.1 heat shock protein 70 (HSP70) [Trypanosoma grayi]
MGTVGLTRAPHTVRGGGGGAIAGFSTRAAVYAVLVLLLFASQLVARVPCAEGRHVLAVDLGSDWAKAATLGGGSGALMRANIVLNDQANRKSPQCVAFRFMPHHGNDTLQSVERVFAEEAQVLEPRFPQQVVCGASLLAGRGLQRDANQQEGNNVSAGKATETESAAAAAADTDEEREENLLSAEDVAALSFALVPGRSGDSLSVRVVDSKDKERALEFSVEELIGMFLGYLKRMAERGLDGEPVRHLAVTVPLVAPLAYRQSIVDAAAVAGLRTVRVVHSTTAAAVQLALLSAEQLFAPGGERDARYVMVYDMGSRHTEAAVYRFTPARKHLGTVTLVSAAVNVTLGGRAFDLCIARYAERELFPRAQPKPIAPVLGKRTAAARKAAVSLLRAANNARERLSVNQEAPLIVQGVGESGVGDFTATILRATFEQECAHLFDEAVRVRDRAIARTKGEVTSVQDLLRFELVGGAARMPKLLQRLSDGYGRAADRRLNSDEATVTGATHMSAARANINAESVRVEEPLTNNVYFSVTPPLNAAEGAEGARHLVFAKGTTLVPALHSLRFPNRTSDFTLTLHDSSGRFARAVSIAGVGKRLLTAQQLPNRITSTTAFAASATNDSGAEAKGTRGVTSLERTEVVVEVTLSDSGIPFVSNAYLRAMYMKETATPVEGDATNRTTAAASATEDNTTHEAAYQGGGEGVEEDATQEQPQEKEDAGEDQQQQQQQGQHKAVEEEEEEAEDEDEKREEIKRDNQVDKKTRNGEGAAASTSTTTPTSGNEGARRFVRSFPLQLAAASVSAGANIDKTEATAARDRLRAFQRADEERLRRSALRNDLESLLLHYKSLDAWGEREKAGGDATDWRETVVDVARWFDEAADDVELPALQQQLQRLKELRAV